MITKKNVVDQVLSNGKITLDEAVKKAQAVKQIKNKDAIRAWKNIFAQEGVVTREEIGVFVSPKTPTTLTVSTPSATPTVSTTTIPAVTQTSTTAIETPK